MKKRITEILNSCGIMDIGFCGFDAVRSKLLDCRAKSRLPENSKTVIMTVFPYMVKKEPPENISRYAAVPDYHTVLMPFLKTGAKKLKDIFPDNTFEPFIDNSPIPEVYAACLSGLGVIGGNGLLITEKYGSFVFLGEIVTDLEVGFGCAGTLKFCKKCGICKTLCPVNLDKSLCLSALTQKKGELSAEEITKLKENKLVWGCDICAQSCPLNKSAETTYIKQFCEEYRNAYTYGEDISGRAYEWRGEKTVRRNYNFSYLPLQASK